MKFLITSALPYANGPIHFGHFAGAYLPADIYAKHRRLQGHKVLHISGSDEHGVAIMQNAQKAKKTYKSYVDKWHKDHSELFDKFQVKFDYFGQTSADYHAEEAVKWFDVLYEKGFIEKRAEDQLQCQSCTNYLPDRYVEGECYSCGFEKARGDECPSCGEWIDAVKLKNPECKFCGSHDIEVKSVDQWYLALSKYHKEFRQWLEQYDGEWRKSVYSFVDSLTKKEMVDRAITRDLDWGIDVPLAEAKGKKLYVWFDAPIGYVSNTKQYLKENNIDEDYMKDWWNADDVQITNFVGKDNIVFHGIIFPMMSMASGLAKPVQVLPANQYLTLEGKKLSKSTGWYIEAGKAVNEFGADSLRYYLATLIPETNDSSFTWDGFEAKINNELANNIGNFVNRALVFFYKNWKEGIPGDKFLSFFETQNFKDMKEQVEKINGTLDKVQVKRALEQIMALGQTANTFFSDNEPWAKIKVDEEECSEVIAHSAIYALVLGALFTPYLPTLSSKILEYFGGVEGELLQDIYTGKFDKLKDFVGGGVTLAKKPKGLVKKIDADRIKELKEELTNKK